MSQKPNLAFIFPGQGSQKIGMLSEFAEVPTFSAAFAEASETLGYDLWALVQEGPQEKLNMTEITQPVLLTSSVALWRLWQERAGAQPSFMAGHSLGEWSALVCAGVVAFSDAVQLVRSRGKYMQEAVPVGKGAMAAIIGVDDDKVEEICRVASQDQVVAPVNYNSPGQLVIAGEKDAVDRAIEGCKEAGAKRALPLPVSAPFHTSLMKPAADRLAAEIMATQFNTPEIQVVHNVNGATEANPDAIKNLMVEQIYSPVRWVDCMKKLVAVGVDTAVECGPGKVLSGLCKRIDKSVNAYATETETALNDTLNAV